MPSNGAINPRTSISTATDSWLAHSEYVSPAVHATPEGEFSEGTVNLDCHLNTLYDHLAHTPLSVSVKVLPKKFS